MLMREATNMSYSVGLGTAGTQIIMIYSGLLSDLIVTKRPVVRFVSVKLMLSYLGF